MTDVLRHSGDLLPRVLLPDPGGSAVDLSHQSIAGNPIILWSIADLAALSDDDRLVALLPAFEAIEARVFAVSRVRTKRLLMRLKRLGSRSLSMQTGASRPHLGSAANRG